MEQLQPYLDQGYQVVQTGYSGVNSLVGLVIALIVVWVMQAWRQWIPSAVFATVLFHLVSALRPMLAGGAFQLPPGLTTAAYWIGMLTTFVGYLVVIAVLFFIKRAVLRRA